MAFKRDEPVGPVETASTSILSENGGLGNGRLLLANTLRQARDASNNRHAKKARTGIREKYDR
jgi:hypothetical protein